MLDCETLKSYADNENDVDGNQTDLTHRAVETHDQSYTQLHPIRPPLLGGVRGTV
jgi:hypothetical protein